MGLTRSLTPLPSLVVALVGALGALRVVLSLAALAPSRSPLTRQVKGLYTSLTLFPWGNMFLLFLDGQPVGSSDTEASVPEGFEAILVDEAPVTPVDSVSASGSLLFFVQPNENTNTTTSQRKP